MKTLYVRIVLTFVFILLVSSICGLLITNIYYQAKLRTFSEEKVTEIAKEMRSLYTLLNTNEEDHKIFSKMANMGFQIYVSGDEEHQFYGDPFRNDQISEEIIRSVQQGHIYRGIQSEVRWLRVAGFFENSVRNSIGIPFETNKGTKAVFIRPNLEQQIGEVRLILAVLLTVTFLVSLILIVWMTRLIVKPVKQLTRATKQIADGQYTFSLDVARKDELGDLSAHFAAMANSLQKLEDMRQEFVANVSHEIQSPLTSIQGFAQTIMEHDTSKEETEHFANIIYKESRRLSLLSEQLLMLAALDKGIQSINRESFRLDEQLRLVLLVTEPQWQKKNIDIELSLQDVLIEADAALLYQVWMNLITNAIKFSNPHSIISVELQVNQDITVLIKDQGIGMHPEQIPHIFTRFYKADGSRDRTTGGSGLGLSISKKIIQLHGGTIDSTSKVNVGTTMEVRLPH